MVRRFLFAVAVLAASPLVILCWFLDVLAATALATFGVYWGLMLLILDREQREAYAVRWSKFALDFCRDNPSSSWGPRLVTFADLAAEAARVS